MNSYNENIFNFQIDTSSIELKKNIYHKELLRWHWSLFGIRVVVNGNIW